MAKEGHPRQFERNNMPEFEPEAVFDIPVDGAKFTTTTNGDILILTNFHLSAKQAASVAWLVNSGKPLHIEIKID